MFCNKFQTIGCEKQYNSLTKEEANKCFEISCTLCTSRGLHIDCDHCAIKAAHEMVITIIEK